MPALPMLADRTHLPATALIRSASASELRWGSPCRRGAPASRAFRCAPPQLPAAASQW